MKKLILFVAVVIAFAINSQAQTYSQFSTGGTGYSPITTSVTPPFNYNLHTNVNYVNPVLGGGSASAHAQVGNVQCHWDSSSQIGPNPCNTSGTYNAPSGPATLFVFAIAYGSSTAFARAIISY